MGVLVILLVPLFNVAALPRPAEAAALPPTLAWPVCSHLPRQVAGGKTGLGTTNPALHFARLPLHLRLAAYQGVQQGLEIARDAAGRRARRSTKSTGLGPA